MNLKLRLRGNIAVVCVFWAAAWYYLYECSFISMCEITHTKGEKKKRNLFLTIHTLQWKLKICGTYFELSGRQGVTNGTLNPLSQRHPVYSRGEFSTGSDWSRSVHLHHAVDFRHEPETGEESNRSCEEEKLEFKL